MEPFDVSLLLYAELADNDDPYALRVLEARVAKDVRAQGRYVAFLLGNLGMDFETTTAPENNTVRHYFTTTELFALTHATHEQRTAAALHALHLKKKAGLT